MYRIGFRGCQHLGYSADRMRSNAATGWNQRILDGYHAHEETMRSMLATGVDGIVDGGDLFHWNKPLPRDVEAANRVDDLRVEDGVWLVGASGNHDAGGGLDVSAAAALHRPHLGANIVYPNALRPSDGGVGPFPGLYEVHSPVEGLAIHVVSHYGLARNLAEQGINIDPQPIDGCVNLFTSHGMLEIDDEWLHALNPHGEERPVPTDWVERPWDAVIMSHIHEQYRVDRGPKDATRGQVWWTGSAVRRGYADDASPRGWLEVQVHDTGDVQVVPHQIWQRPQVDLPVIDAEGLSVADMDDLVTEHLTGLDLHDPESETRTGHGGIIVRQRVRGATPTQRQGLNTHNGTYANTTAAASFWRLAFDRSGAAVLPTGSEQSHAVTHRITDFTRALDDRAGRLLDGIGTPTGLRDAVVQAARTHTDPLTGGNGRDSDDTASTTSKDAA